MALLTKKLPEWKERQIKEFAEKIKSAKTIGLVDIKGMPASQLHQIRSKLRDSIGIHVVKKTIIKFAMEHVKHSKKNMAEIEAKIPEMPALIISDLDPFKMSKLFIENKAPAFAKPGQLAPEDIAIQEGPTPFTPGPMIAELGAIGIKVKVDAGKLVVQQRTVVAKKGEPIKPAVADLLVKLNIQPMEVRLSLAGAWSEEKVYGADVLNFNLEELMAELNKAASDTFMLSLGLPYPTKENISILVSKTYREAKSLAIERGIIVKELMGELLAKAIAQANALESIIPK